MPRLQSTKCKQKDQEYILYVTPNGERKAAIIVSNKIGKAFIERLTFDSFEIEDLHIDFLNNKCSFTYNENHLETEVVSNIQNILLGFFIQYHKQSIAFFTYRKRRNKDVDAT
ncbi:hypothetical protein MHH33_14570 [Paenisporosarcina sp. FSL H8-0542]|uniref:hypothetical protein n=1 Tax=Paenisporosarcina sp. FSL H8-0542 TaxID=2921401 RepID=UPI003159C5C3